MAIYLIDYENTKNLLGINCLSADDCVVIFYSQKANSLSFDIHKEIISSQAKIEYKYVDVGSQNALDFQLSSYLGYVIKQNEGTECKIYIVSKDKGFAFVSSFWGKEKSLDIQILSDLTGEPQNTVSTAKSKKTVSESPKPKCDIESLLKKSDVHLSKNEIKEVISIVNKYKSPQAINGNLNKLFKDSTKTGTILKIIKPFIKK